MAARAKLVQKKAQRLYILYIYIFTYLREEKRDNHGGFRDQPITKIRPTYNIFTKNEGFPRTISGDDRELNICRKRRRKTKFISLL